MKFNLLRVFFEFVSDTILGAEKSLLDFLSALVPYFVPIIPAYLTYYHTWKMMDFPTWVAATSAFVVEVLGLASVSTAIRFYRHNQKYSTAQNRAPFTLAVAIYLFYIVVVLVVNVVLEKVNGTRGDWIIFAIGMFSLLSIPSGVLISIRTQFAEMLEEKENARQERKAEKTTARGGAAPAASVPSMGFSAMNGPRTKYASDYKTEILSMLDTAYAKGKILDPREITAKLKLSHDNNKGYISTLRTQWKRSKGIE